MKPDTIIEAATAITAGLLGVLLAVGVDKAKVVGAIQGLQSIANNLAAALEGEPA